MQSKNFRFLAPAKQNFTITAEIHARQEHARAHWLRSEFGLDKEKRHKKKLKVRTKKRGKKFIKNETPDPDADPDPGRAFY